MLWYPLLSSAISILWKSCDVTSQADETNTVQGNVSSGRVPLNGIPNYAGSPLFSLEPLIDSTDIVFYFVLMHCFLPCIRLT